MLLQITAFSVGITILNQRIIQKDDIKFVTEFPCLLGHPRLYNFIYGFHYLGDDIFRTLECNLSKQPWYIYSSFQFAEFLQYNSIQFVPLQSSFKHQNQHHQSQHAYYQAYLLRFQG